jgi:hypothetical protein
MNCFGAEEANYDMALCPSQTRHPGEDRARIGEPGDQLAQAARTRLRNAAAAVLSENEGHMRAFCEDYGMDQVDPVTKLDVLRYAMKNTSVPRP